MVVAPPKVLDPKVWGPHYWFFLHTIAMTYPRYPNAITKKKYYDFIQNLPLFLPIESISTEMEHLLNQFPVTPYLDNQDSLVKWFHFIHNKINEKLEKPTVSFHTFLAEYDKHYETTQEQWLSYVHTRQKVVYGIVMCSMIGVAYYLYHKV